MLEVKFGNDLNKGSYTNFASNSNRINFYSCEIIRKLEVYN